MLNQLERCRHESPPIDKWWGDDHDVAAIHDTSRWGRKRLEEVSTLRKMFYGAYWQAPKLAKRANANDPQVRFNVLADRWRDETAVLSSLTKKITHPAYLEIIGMGPVALPMILKRLEVDPGYWFTALRALSGIDPVGPDARGSYKATRQAWLNWGRARGLL